MTFKPGDLYRRSAIQQSQRRLYGLELFQFANVAPQDQELQPPDVPINVTVAEGRHQRMNFGFGYGTDEKWRVDAEYHHFNFLGDARTAGLHVRYSSLDRGVRADFTQPYLFAPHLSLTLEAQKWYSFTPAYNSNVTGGKATIVERLSQRTSVAFSIQSENQVSSVDPEVLADPTHRNDLIALGLDPVTGEQSGTLTAYGFDAQHSTVDSLLDSRHGYQLAVHFEAAGKGLPGTYNYYGLSGDARYYLPLSDRVVLASRAQFGTLVPKNNDQTLVPFSKKLFLGGSTSLRGWGRYEVSPLSDGLPIGGNSMLAFSEEVRALLPANLGGVLFLDAGNVWAQNGQIRLDDLRYDVGAGIRYQTPVGPVRFDFGYQLNPIPDLLVNGEPQTRRWRVHFSIGQAF
jgi:outer membrane protein assembly factor BamA